MDVTILDNYFDFNSVRNVSQDGYLIGQGLEYVKDLPVDFRNQDLSSMARLLVGLNLKPREACEAHWEAECLEDEWVRTRHSFRKKEFL